MKPVSLCLSVIVLGAAVAGQSTPGTPDPGNRAVVAGIVTKEPGGEPVKKALIELIAENQAESGNYTAMSGADGVFRVEGIAAGRYRLYAERTGLLEMDRHHARSEGRVLSVVPGQELKDVAIRMQVAAVVRGRITDEDGEPLPNANVAVLRQTFASGHGRWEQAGAERTNDLGEYRVAGLPPGNYYVSVSPPPDFKSLIEEAGRARSTADAGAPEKPTATTFQTTYYPGTTDRSQAAPIQLRPGDEFPLNLSLAPSPSLSIRGSVVNLPAHSSASILLQSRDFGLMLNGGEMHNDGSFVIRDVAPGAYTILATVENSVVPMTARQALQVGGTNIEGLRLAPQPGATVRGRLHLETKGSVGQIDASQIFFTLESAERDDAGGITLGQGFSNLAQLMADGSLEWRDVPPGEYYVRLASEMGENRDWFVKSESVGGRDA